MRIVPIILCGGSGTHLWPMSRGGYPKQSLNLSLIQQTAKRLHGVEGIAAPIVVTNNEQRFLVGEQLGQTAGTAVRDHAGAGRSQYRAGDRSRGATRDAMLLVLPSDHVILKERVFVDLAKAASTIAVDKQLVTFGMEPANSCTGYGYIRVGAALVG